MKSIEQILVELGIAVPEDKKAALKTAMGENYRTKADYDKVAAKRDEYKNSLEDVQGKLDGFKDVDIDDLKGQIATLTTNLANEKAARQADAAKGILEKNVGEFLSGKKFVNALTEKSIRASLMEELEKDTAKGKSIDDIFKGLISDKDGKQLENILVDEAAAGAARFTGPATRPGGGKAMTKDEIMKITDRAERRAAIAQNMSLFQKGE